MKLDNTIDLMREYADIFRDELIETMKNYGSQNLYNKIDTELDIRDDSIMIVLVGPPGVYYFSEGRGPGKMPPEAPILKWIKERNVKFKNKKGKFLEDRTTAFLIRRKIGREGTKKNAPHFLKDFDLENNFIDELTGAYKKDIINDIIDFVKNNISSKNINIKEF